MNWIIASLLMFVSSVILYTLIRKASLNNIPTMLINLACFFVPLLFYILLVVTTKTNLTIKPHQLLLIFVLSIVGSWLPNITSLKSIKYAPNPGYSLIISKSYVVFTTIVAILLFHSQLTIKSAVAIVIIVLFSCLITIGKTKKHQHSNSLWLPFAFYSFFGWGILSIGTKYAFSIGISIYQRLVYLSIFVSIYILIETLIKRSKLKTIKLSDYLLLLLIGFFSALFNYFMTLGIDLAPNIGYVNAINASSISLVTLVAFILYKDELSIRKFIGIIGVIGGLTLLLI